MSPRERIVVNVYSEQSLSWVHNMFNFHELCACDKNGFLVIGNEVGRYLYCMKDSSITYRQVRSLREPKRLQLFHLLEKILMMAMREYLRC